MRVGKSLRPQIASARDSIKRRPYASLFIFVVIVVAVSVAGYARYQHVQAELAAQQTLSARIQRGFSDWRDDLSQRLGDLTASFQGTAEGATNLIGGVWGIVRYIVTALLDFVGNLHIMIPVTVIYFGVGFFGTLRMRVATLIGALIAFLLSISIGIVYGSVIGLFLIAALLLWNKIDPRLLTAIQGLPAKIKDRIQRARNPSHGNSQAESEAEGDAAAPQI